MTNEEKAKEIAECCSVMPLTPITQSDVLAMTNNAAMQAMEWKDEGHAKEKQKLIDEACEWLFKNDSYAIPTNVQVDRLREYLNDIK